MVRNIYKYLLSMNSYHNKLLIPETIFIHMAQKQFFKPGIFPVIQVATLHFTLKNLKSFLFQFFQDINIYNIIFNNI